MQVLIPQLNSEPKSHGQSHIWYNFVIGASLIGASLSEPHIDELNVRNPYIMFFVWYVVRPSPAGRHRHCTSVRDIFHVRDIVRLAA